MHVHSLHCQTITKREEQERCDICKQKMFKYKEVWYPCRICDRVFHKKCIISRGDVHQNDIDTIEKANTNIGWSCHLCVSMSFFKGDFLLLYWV